MTTLAALKAEIADDLDRDDLANQIASEIAAAIRHYQAHRLYFSESRERTFATVAGQTWYGVADDPAIPAFVAIDAMWIEDGAASHRLDRLQPDRFEDLAGGATASGRPASFTWFGLAIGLHPVPDGAYTVRPSGHVQVAAPASDAEAGNPWMVDGYHLIRFRALRRLHLHKLKDPESAAMAAADELDEFSRLKAETGRRVATGRLRPTAF